MSRPLEELLRHHPRPFLTDVEISLLAKGTPASRYGKVKRLLAQEKLLSIRRGLYGVSDNLNSATKSHPFELAQYIYGPSYISLESALSFHQLIPESVYELTSVCTKRTKKFHTPLGVFSYAHLPLKNFYLDVDIVTMGSARFFIAKPWKALCDYIFCYKKEWSGLDARCQDLRIEEDELPFLSDLDKERLDEYYHQQRITRFLKKARGNPL